MSRPMEKVFFVLTFIFQGPNYLSAYGYGVMHRLHHAYADTEKDPHSPKISPSFLRMMWDTKTIYGRINQRKMEVDPKFTKNVPDFQPFDKFFGHTYTRIAWMAVYTLLYLWMVPMYDHWGAIGGFQLNWLLYLLLLGHFAMSPIHGAIINWFAHKYGYRNFEVGDTSTNLLPFDFLMWGESYHNNHHKYGARANFGGFRWHEIDPLYLVIRLFDKIGIINYNHKTQHQRSY